MKNVKTKDMVLISLLIGLNVVIARFLSINVWNTKIGFAFLTVFVAAYIYGPIGGAIVGGAGDLIGALLFPVGPFYPAFTITACLVGIIFGLFLHHKDNIKNIVLAVLINELVLSLLLNTFWISVLYNASFNALLVTRSIQAIIMIAVEIISIKLLIKALPSLERRIK